jgi:hypothetical protein
VRRKNAKRHILQLRSVFGEIRPRAEIKERGHALVRSHGTKEKNVTVLGSASNRPQLVSIIEGNLQWLRYARQVDMGPLVISGKAPHSSWHTAFLRDFLRAQADDRSAPV